MGVKATLVVPPTPKYRLDPGDKASRHGEKAPEKDDPFFSFTFFVNFRAAVIRQSVNGFARFKRPSNARGYLYP